MLYGSYLGGANAQEHIDGGTSRFNKDGVLFQGVCGGCGGYSDFPTTNGAWSTTNNSANCNNLIYKFDFEIIPKAGFQMSSNEGCAPFELDLTNTSLNYVNLDWVFPPQATIVSSGTSPELLFNIPGTYQIGLSVSDTNCYLLDSVFQTITVHADPISLSVTADTTLYVYGPVNLVANSMGSASNFKWADNSGFSPLLVSGAIDSLVTVNPTSTTTYYAQVTNGFSACDLTDSVTVFLSPNISIGNEGELTMLMV